MLTETYRPKDWHEIVGQDSIIKKLALWERSSSLTGRALWISGKSGHGKTSIARIVASKVSDHWHTEEMDASELTASKLKTIQENSHYRPMSCKARCYIVNEAHGLRADIVRKLLQLLEAPYLNEHTVWCFTTTLEGQTSFEDGQIDASQLLSRCTRLHLNERKIAPVFAKRLQEIAQEAKMDGQPIEAYIKLIQKHRNNFRAALQDIEDGAMIV